MAPDKPLRIILITAAVTFLISGLGGAGVNEWLKRAKPDLVIRSIGFSSSTSDVLVGEALKHLAKTNPWNRDYATYESPKSLSSDHATLARTEERLKRGIRVAEAWIRANGNWATGGRPPLTVSDLLATPYMQDNIVGSLLLGSLRRGEVAPPPELLETVTAAPVVSELFRDERGWVIWLKTQNTRFPDEDTKSSIAKLGIELLARSYEHASMMNIYFYTQQFMDLSYRQLQMVQEHKTLLEGLLLPSSHITVAVSIYNSGAAPFTLKPYLALSFANEGLKDDAIILAIQADEPGSVPGVAELLSLTDRDMGGTDVKVDTFLPETIESEYIFVAPNSEKQIRLVSVQELGQARGRRILDLFKANTLNCRVAGLSSAERLVVSPNVVFGESISAEDKVSIESAVKRQ